MLRVKSASSRSSNNLCKEDAPERCEERSQRQASNKKSILKTGAKVKSAPYVLPLCEENTCSQTAIRKHENWLSGLWRKQMLKYVYPEEVQAFTHKWRGVRTSSFCLLFSHIPHMSRVSNVVKVSFGRNRLHMAPVRPLPCASRSFPQKWRRENRSQEKGRKNQKCECQKGQNDDEEEADDDHNVKQIRWLKVHHCASTCKGYYRLVRRPQIF